MSLQALRMIRDLSTFYYNRRDYERAYLVANALLRCAQELEEDCTTLRTECRMLIALCMEGKGACVDAANMFKVALIKSERSTDLPLRIRAELYGHLARVQLLDPQCSRVEALQSIEKAIELLDNAAGPFQMNRSYADVFAMARSPYLSLFESSGITEC
jgi:hypothetical protein